MLTEYIILSDEDLYSPDRWLVDQLCALSGDPPYLDGVFTDYFSSYCGLVLQEKPKRFLEIGTRFGATATIMYQALREFEPDGNFHYLGIDDESYHYNSCWRANENFKILIPWADARCLKHNSITQGLPANCGTFDLISVDGNKEYRGRMNDLLISWAHLNVGGIIVIDDCKQFCDDGSIGEPYQAAMDFLEQFEHGNKNVEWQYRENLTGHIYLRRLN